MVPTFLHVMTNGDLWISSQLADTPSGTIAGTYRIADGSTLTKLGTVSGSNPYSSSGSTGKNGNELGTRK